MIRVIDGTTKAKIQKVTHGDKVLGYQVVPQGAEGDSSKISRFPMLQAARELLAAFYNDQQPTAA